MWGDNRTMEAKTSHYEIRVQGYFSAAHHLRDYQGKCKNVHGHNWKVDVYVECDKLNDIGISIDFYDVRKALKGIIDHLDHSDLNNLPQFQSENPSSENIAKYIYRELNSRSVAPGVSVIKVCVAENSSCAVTYWESGD
jgi:6-pyruvoyltetrahydropterin/6-carboxytetrahydropterin synthase